VTVLYALIYSLAIQLVIIFFFEQELVILIDSYLNLN
jgi:hypothetical protein